MYTNNFNVFLIPDSYVHSRTYLHDLEIEMNIFFSHKSTPNVPTTYNKYTQNIHFKATFINAVFILFLTTLVNVHHNHIPVYRTSNLQPVIYYFIYFVISHNDCGKEIQL